MINHQEMTDLEQKLKDFFGYNSFRIYQKEIIEALLEKKDVLAILPTGAGKSICYQLPALLLPGTALVISPLISLMQDQVVSLYKNGISAAFLNSSLHYQEMQQILTNLSDYKLIYVAPERFADPTFLQRLKEIEISLFAIDEAHCISQWGHSFRTEYRKLSLLKEHFPTKPIVALTATATQEVEQDIKNQLVMREPTIIKGSFDRPNLTIRIHPKICVDKQLTDFLKSHSDQSGIIYAATRKTVDATFNKLQQAGLRVERYHAGMPEKDRMAAQHVFLHDQVQCMVATVAFGMGIHKPDVRFIVHLDMPKTIEQYYQEIGRAGRDGLPAECLMLYGAQEGIVYKSLLEQVEDPLIREQMRFKIDRMSRLCNSMKCRRQELLNYFGEFPSFLTCVSCDNCIDDIEMIEGTVIAQKILSSVFRLRQNVGIRLVIDVLRGSKGQALLNRGYQELSTYGILADLAEKEVRYYIEYLIHLGFLTLTEGPYPVLKWTETSKGVIDGIYTVQFRKKVFKETKTKVVQDVLYPDEKLFLDLKQLRLEMARQEKVPPYVIFSDRSLQEMAVYLPKNQAEFSKINGVGPIKWVRYGEKFLTHIQAYMQLNAIPYKAAEKPLEPVQRRNSLDETISLYQKGYSLEQIIAERQLARSTVLTHLVESIQEGEELDLSRLVPEDKQQAIKQVIEQVGAAKLAPIKEQLPVDYTYDEIRLVAAFYRREKIKTCLH